jgi:hypothetical protein
MNVSAGGNQVQFLNSGQPTVFKIQVVAVPVHPLFVENELANAVIHADSNDGRHC